MPHDPPLIQPNDLVENEDRRAIVKGLREARELLHSRELSNYLVAEMLSGMSVTDNREWIEYV